MHTVDVAVEEGVSADVGGLEADALRLLDLLGLQEAELSLLITDDTNIRALNAQWRAKDEPTDVLSFPQQEGEVTGGVLGDLVISVQTAAAQADSMGHDLGTELRVLLVHGLCHLLGYDHLETDEADVMSAEELRLLGALGVVGEARGLIARGGQPD